MSGALRQSRILDFLNTQGECSVDFLAGQFGVSGMTIRRDLQDLQEAGRVLRTHGGAAPADRVSFEFKFLERGELNEPAKRNIAATATKLVGDARTVMLDSGTTTLALARRLRGHSGISVITTSLPIASELQFCSEIEVILLGGILRNDAPDLAGALTEANLESLRADVAFIGADGIDEKGNVYNGSLAVGRMLGKMAAAARRVYAVADSSKVGRTALMKFGKLAEWDGLITDRGIDRSARAAITAAGGRVIIAAEGEE